MSQESDILDAETMKSLWNDPAVQFGVEAVLNSPVAATDITHEFGGKHSFQVEVITPKYEKQFYYSDKLNEIFVEMNKTISLKIKWDGSPLYVRGVLIFAEPDRLKDPVKRCISHRSSDNPINIGYKHLEHVLTCESDSAIHEMDEFSKRYSVKVPIYYHEETNYTTITFKLMCLTSCTGGINRSLTDLVLTLENESCQVLGRRKIAIRICAAPRRDMRKKEKEKEHTFTKIKRRKVKEEAHDVTMTPPNPDNSPEGRPSSSAIMIEPASTEDGDNIIAIIKRYNDETIRKRGTQAIWKIKRGYFSEEKL